jgi:membrane protease YdiL (CAAX protease family)
VSNQDSSQSAPGAWLGLDRDEVAYLAPMLSFMLFIWIGSEWKELYPWAYVGRTICAATLLWIFRKRYTPIRWNYWWLGILTGIVGIVQWIGMDTLLQQSYRIFGVDLTQPSDGSVSYSVANAWRKFFYLDPDKAFNPTTYFSNPIALNSWIAVRLIGASLVVPVMEELFWRDYLWRRIIAPVDFKLAKVGEWDAKAFWIVSIAFCVVHPQWLTAIGWGLLVGLLLVRTRSLGACIIMHGVTNLLLGLWVLKTQQWQWW